MAPCSNFPSVLISCNVSVTNLPSSTRTSLLPGSTVHKKQFAAYLAFSIMSFQSKELELTSELTSELRFCFFQVKEGSFIVLYSCELMLVRCTHNFFNIQIIFAWADRVLPVGSLPF